MTSEKTIRKVADLFNTVERWQAFCELVDQKEEVEKFWAGELIRESSVRLKQLLPEFTLKKGGKLCLLHKNEDNCVCYYWTHRCDNNEPPPKGISVALEIGYYDGPFICFGLYFNKVYRVSKKRWKDLRKKYSGAFNFNTSEEKYGEDWAEEKLPEDDWIIFENCDLTFSNDPIYPDENKSSWYIGHDARSAATQLTERVKKYLEKNGHNIINLNKKLGY